MVGPPLLSAALSLLFEGGGGGAEGPANHPGLAARCGVDFCLQPSVHHGAVGPVGPAGRADPAAGRHQ